MASGSRLLTAAEVARQIQENSDPLDLSDSDIDIEVCNFVQLCDF